MTVAQMYSPAKEILAGHNVSLEEADDLLREIAQNNRQPNFAESVFFQQAIGWTTDEVRNQLRRMNSVLRFQGISGSTQDREAASREATTAAEILAKEGPKVADQIEKLQAKLTGLDRDARLSQKRVDEQITAVGHLKKLCPQNLVESVRHSLQAIEASTGQRLREFEGRDNELSCCLDKSRYETEEAYLESLRRSFRDAVEITVNGRYQTLSLSPQWPAIKSDIESELAGIRKNLEPMRLQHSAAIAQAELSLNFYV